MNDAGQANDAAESVKTEAEDLKDSVDSQREREAKVRDLKTEARRLQRRAAIARTTCARAGGAREDLARSACEPARGRASKHRVDHRLGQPPGEGVLLARVVGAEQHRPAVHAVLGAVAEARLAAAAPSSRQAASQAKPPRQTITRGRSSSSSSRRVGEAVVALGGQRPVGGRRAAHGRGHEGAVEAQAVVAVSATSGWLAKPVRWSAREQPVARAVAGEHAAGAVAAVCGGREAEHVDARGRVAEARHRPAPVVLVAKGGALLARHPLAPLHEPRAAAAAHHLRLEQLEPALAQSFSFFPVVNRYCAHA